MAMINLAPRKQGTLTQSVIANFQNSYFNQTTRLSCSMHCVWQRLATYFTKTSLFVFYFDLKFFF